MFEHYTVLKTETVELVLGKSDGIYVDGTYGGGGHSELLLKKLSSKAQVFGFDQDLTAIKKNENKYKNLKLIHSNFRFLKEKLAEQGVTTIDGLILDLGFSSPQIDDPTRGFSYMQDGPLDMRMNSEQDISAYKVINEYSEERLAQIFKRYGEEKFSQRIASKIVKQRQENMIGTTLELVEIIESAIPMKFLKKIKGHSAKRVFQALRIYVNQEIQVLEEVLDVAFSILNPGGKIAIISFHSLEDKIVKHKYLSWDKIPEEIIKLPIIPDAYKSPVKILTKKPILPSEEEILENSRSKSAKLRGVMKK